MESVKETTKLQNFYNQSKSWIEGVNASKAPSKKWKDSKTKSNLNTYQPIVSFKLPVNPEERKDIPIYTGFINYFPRAIAEVSKVSLSGGLQHGQTKDTLHWDREKSGDELDAMMRHLLDEDWAQVAWRAMANLEKQLEKEI